MGLSLGTWTGRVRLPSNVFRAGLSPPSERTSIDQKSGAIHPPLHRGRACVSSRIKVGTKNPRIQEMSKRKSRIKIRTRIRSRMKIRSAGR